ncbi:MAG: hypothetical protein HZA53_07265, partial [Planctomycetes bacterium]|nr:hypothetical protein [Planctomycetota bacterium]
SALQRFSGRGWLPGVEENYLEMSCSLCRSEAVDALIELDRERFARTYALECLWDCESSTSEAAIPHVPIERAHSRLAELADACAPRGAAVRAAALARLASA